MFATLSSNPSEFDQVLASPLTRDTNPGFEPSLKKVATLHRHLCPRQVLGVRMGLLGGQRLQLDLPQTHKRLLVIVETDGCFADGVAVATNCWLGRRTMRLEDYGKVAATFIDTQTGAAVRLAPQPAIRSRAYHYAPQARNRWEAMLLGYQRMPSDELLSIQPVKLKQPIEQLISRAGVRTTCQSCGEEILNEREIESNGQTLCRACAGSAYYNLQG